MKVKVLAMKLEIKRITTKDTNGNISTDFHMIRNKLTNNNFSVIIEGEVLNSPITINIYKRK